MPANLSEMQTNERNADIQEEGFMQLQNLVEKNDNNQVAIAEAEGITKILSAMKNHPSNATVQEYGCTALWRLSSNDINQIKIAEADFFLL